MKPDIKGSGGNHSSHRGGRFRHPRLHGNQNRFGLRGQGGSLPHPPPLMSLPTPPPPQPQQPPGRLQTPMPQPQLQLPPPNAQTVSHNQYNQPANLTLPYLILYVPGGA